jgi:hypothetical protein
MAGFHIDIEVARHAGLGSGDWLLILHSQIIKK